MPDQPGFTPAPRQRQQHDPALAEAWNAGHAAGQTKRRGVPWLVLIIGAPLLMLGSCGVGSVASTAGDVTAAAPAAIRTVEVPGPTVTAEPKPAETVTTKAEPAPAVTVTADPEPAPTVTVTSEPEPAPTVTITETAPAVEPESEPEPEPEPEPTSGGGGSVYYDNCTAVRAAGADPIRVGDPGYDTHLDRDGDGIGCE